MAQRVRFRLNVANVFRGIPRHVLGIIGIGRYVHARNIDGKHAFVAIPREGGIRDRFRSDVRFFKFPVLPRRIGCKIEFPRRVKGKKSLGIVRLIGIHVRFGPQINTLKKGVFPDGLPFRRALLRDGGTHRRRPMQIVGIEQIDRVGIVLRGADFPR